VTTATTAPIGWPPASKAQRESARARFPARLVTLGWPATRRRREQVWEQLNRPPFVLANVASQGKRIRGVTRMLDWLQAQPGDTWQERWAESGAEAGGADWRQVPMRWLADHRRRSQWLPAELNEALRVVICADLVHPSLRWLMSVPSIKGTLARHLALTRDPEGFARLEAQCDSHPGMSALARKRTLRRSSMILAAKGGLLTDILVGDVLELLDVETNMLAAWQGDGPVFYQMLHELGIFDDQAPARLRELRTGGQRTPDELIDRYQLACRPIRDLLVDYLRERQPGLDYNSLRALAYYLGKRFWKDLELHHPGINSLHLPADLSGAWRQRLLIQSKTVATGNGGKTTISIPRVSYGQCLTSVRAFYLDISQWALEDPARWARWVAPCPVSQDEIGNRKFVRRRKARMDARTRERLPVLPVLVRTVDQRRKNAEELLNAARQADPGDTITAAAQTVTRSILAKSTTTTKIYVDDPDSGKRRDLCHEEEYAFWAWAAVEVLRLTGVRVEELLEISHHSLIQYRLPATGEIVPLLQIAPSKTDAERLLVVSPGLADVLSSIIQRVREPSGTVPLAPAYDWHECIWMPPAPLLFQRRFRTENRAISHGTLRKMLQAALAGTGLADPVDGTPLNYTPHDFRRIFITDAIMNGLPPHIAQVIAGHRDINVTLTYKAVYPDEAVQTHLAFLARRRALRPTEEYRVPTDKEWQEFLGHFELRKVATGTCGRAFGTPCIHEHSCLRCPLHWPSPGQRPRIAEIRDNLITRIAEAQREGWLGEVEGLKISLAGAEDKLTQIDRRSHTPVDLGIPAVATTR
jgi:integrase